MKSLRPAHSPALVALLAAAMLSGCAGPGSPADCSGLAGSYLDRGVPSGESLAKTLLGRVVPKTGTVRIAAGEGQLQVIAGATRAILTGAEFLCTAPNELRLVREETSRIHVPPLTDQTRTTSYVLRGGPAKDLVLSTYTRTTASPYGLALKGPLQLDSTTTWRREAC